MGIINFLFKPKSSKIKDFLKRNAIIIDVRTQQEWNDSHIENAIHIPLKTLKDKVEAIKKLDKPIIVYCKSGVRSEKAKAILKSQHIEVVNGGGMDDLKQLL
ncbi:rhodanese-like domain-containing protein [Flavobacteriaceae bacterium MHTCC 0001]